MIYQNDIANLKTNISNKIGEKIIVKGSLGRSKLFEKEAIIEKTYPNIFVVKYEDNDRSVSYQYKDVLTRTVEVDVFDGNGYSSLVPPPVKKTRRRHSNVNSLNVESENGIVAENLNANNIIQNTPASTSMEVEL